MTMMNDVTSVHDLQLPQEPCFCETSKQAEAAQRASKTRLLS